MGKSVAEHLKACARIALRAVGKNRKCQRYGGIVRLSDSCPYRHRSEEVEAYADVRQAVYRHAALAFARSGRIVCRQQISVLHVLSHVARALAKREGNVVRCRRLRVRLADDIFRGWYKVVRHRHRVDDIVRVVIGEELEVFGILEHKERGI